MEFMVFTLITLAICVLLTFKIINYFGLRLGIGPLVLCALCALSINFTLPSVTLYASNYHFVFFIGLTLLSASIITLYNERFPADTPDDTPTDSGGETPLDYLPCLQPALVSVGSFAIPAKAPIQITFPHESVCMITPLDNLPPAQPVPAFFAIHAVSSLSTAPQPFRAFRLPALITPTIRALAERDMIKKARDKKFLSRLNLWSLDALLEYAYDQKGTTDMENALLAFKCALDRFRNDDYAPFITIEIGNIYKNTGFYDEAIVIYNKAFYLRAVMASDELKKEFKNMIYYLHILKIILRKHHSQGMPFDQIPKALMLETETEFQVWLSQKYAS